MGGGESKLLYNVWIIVVITTECHSFRKAWASKYYFNNNNNKRPLTPKSMPPAGDKHAKHDCVLWAYNLFLVWYNNTNIVGVAVGAFAAPVVVAKVAVR